MEGLKDDMGRWITKKEELKIMVSSFFKRLYSTEDQPNVDTYPLSCLFPELELASLIRFEAKITFEKNKGCILQYGRS